MSADQHIKQRITDSLKALTQQAMAADEILTTLAQENIGRFSAIFPKHKTFRTTATRFLPYLEEINLQVENLPPMTEDAFQPELQSVMNKMGMLFEILNTFHEIRDDQ